MRCRGTRRDTALVWAHARASQVRDCLQGQRHGRPTRRWVRGRPGVRAPGAPCNRARLLGQPTLAGDTRRYTCSCAGRTGSSRLMIRADTAIAQPLHGHVSVTDAIERVWEKPAVTPLLASVAASRRGWLTGARTGHTLMRLGPAREIDAIIALESRGRGRLSTECGIPFINPSGGLRRWSRGRPISSQICEEIAARPTRLALCRPCLSLPSVPPCVVSGSMASVIFGARTADALARSGSGVS